MQAEVTPQDVEVESSLTVTRDELKKAEESGACIKYICEAVRTAGADKLRISVKPARIPLTHPFAGVDGTSAAITFYTDLAGELTILQINPALLQTAYGVYSDLITILKSLKREEDILKR